MNQAERNLFIVNGLFLVEKKIKNIKKKLFINEVLSLSKYVKF